ncbi:MAG: hypothetical protein ABSH33_21055 [Steroidobacteraceae bacterium]
MRLPSLGLMVTLALAGISAVALAQSNGGAPPGYQPIPAPLAETVPPPPPQGAYIWRPGHWKWNGYKYHWVVGEYVLRRPKMHEWVPGAWVMQGGAWVWAEPHWR